MTEHQPTLTPQRAVAILAEQVRRAEAALADRAEAVQRDAERLVDTTTTTRTLNSLGELQGRPSMMEAAAGAVCASRDALELVAQCVPVVWNEYDWDMLTYAAARSAFVAQVVARRGWAVEA